MVNRAKFRFKKIKKIRYESPNDEETLSRVVYQEIVQFMQAARIPPRVALSALETAIDELQDAVFADTPSFSLGSDAKREPVKLWHGGGREKIGRRALRR